jgi:glycosyltransferase involved in cell wall biosynthesis
MKPLVSILVPVYNREAIIAETLESALSQTYKNIEVIVVDNASTDRTWCVVQSFLEKNKNIKAFRNETNLGPVRNWLRCVEEAKGEFGKILWSDDLIAPDFLHKTLPFFNEDVGFVYTAANIFSGVNPLDGKTSYLLPNSGQYSTLLYIEKAIYDEGVPVSPGCAIFRMSDIRKNLWLNIPNKVNSDFSMHAIGNDLLLFLLTANDYKYFGYVSEPLSFFRAHEGSISISSKSGKLPLHYALVRAFFTETYRQSLLNKHAAQIQIMLWRFSDSKKFNMNTIEDFYNSAVHIDKVYLIKVAISKLISLPIKLVKLFWSEVTLKWK